MASDVTLPKGFVLDPPPNTTLPEGFTLDPPPEDDSSALENFGKGVLKGTRKIVDVGAGIVSAPTALLQGLSETVSAGSDKFLGTNITPTVTKTFDTMLEPYRPETAVGNISQLATEEAIKLVPFFKLTSLASRAAKAKAAGTAIKPAKSKIGRGAQSFGQTKAGQKLFSPDGSLKAMGVAVAGTGGAAAAYNLGAEFLFSPDSRPTLSDQFDVLPDFLETEEYSGQKGVENANRVLSNKLKRGAEIAALGGVLDAGFFGAQAIAKSPMVATPLSATVRGTASTLRKASDFAGEKLADTYVSQLYTKGKTNLAPVFDIAGQKLVRYFTPDGGADPILAQAVRDTVDKGDALQRQSLSALDDFHAATNNLLKRTKFWQRGKPEATELRNDLDAYLRFNMTPDEFVNKYGSSAREAADRMAVSRAEHQDYILARLERQRDTLDASDARKQVTLDAIDVIKETNATGEGYLRRIFEAKESPEKFLRDLLKKGGLRSPEYLEAVEEVANNLAFMKENASLTPQQVRQQAQEVVNDSIHIKAILDENSDPDAVLKNTIAGFKQVNEGKLLSPNVSRFSVVEDMFIAKKDLIDKSPKFRKFLGEVTDPVEAYVRTTSDLAKTGAATELYSQILMSPALSKNISSDVISGIENGVSRPSVVRLPTLSERSQRLKAEVTGVRYQDSTENPMRGLYDEIREQFGSTTAKETSANIEALEERLRAAGYQKLGADEDGIVKEGITIFGGRYGDLTGQFVSPETFRALHEPLNLSPFNDAIGIFQQLRAFSQKMAIVPSPTTQVRNIVGNLEMLFMNGNVQRNLNVVDAFEVLTKTLSQMSDDRIKELADVLNNSGLQDSSVIYKSLKEYASAGKDLAWGGKLAKGIQGFEDIVPFMQQAEKLYGGSDALFKALAYMGERNKLGNAFAKSGLNPDNPLVIDILREQGLARGPTGLGISNLGLLDTVSVNIVKDTMPMYDRVPEALRFLDRIPLFGNFTSFASENIRNGFNVLDRGLREVSFEISTAQKPALVADLAKKGLSPEEALKALDIFEKQIRGIGAQRLSNTFATTIVVPKGLTKFSQKVTQSTDQQLEGLEESVPDFSRGGDFIILENDHKGNMEIIDQSYHNPYGYITQAAKAGLEAYDEAGRLGKNEVQQLLAGAKTAIFEKFADPFGSETIIYDRLRTVLPTYTGFGRGGETSTGAKVYTNSDTQGESVVKGITHILEGLAPRYWLEIAEERGGELRPGKLTRSLTGMPGPYGDETDPRADVARLVTGFTPMKVSGVQSLGFNAEEYQKLRNDAKGAAGRILRAPDRSSAEKAEAYSDYVEDIKRSQALMHDAIRTAEKLGTPADDIERVLSGQGLGRAEIGNLMNGLLYITPVSEDFQKDLVQYNSLREITPMEEIPFDLIEKTFSENLNSPLATTRMLTEQEADAGQRYINIDMSLPPGFTLDPPPAKMLPPGFTLDPPPAPPVSAPQGRVDPAILGNDPATQALAKSLGRSQ